MQTVRRGAIEIAYWREGAGPPLVWIQGLNADHTAWTSQLLAFRAEYDCLALDNRDVGRSGRATAPYDLAEMAADVRAVLDDAAVEDAHIVGLSMGGAIAQELALTAPEWVRSLTLVSTFARPDARLSAILEAWRVIYPILGPSDFARQSWPWLFSWRFFERPSNLRNLQRYADNAPHPQEPDAFVRQVGVTLDQDRRERLAALHIPTLVLAGAEDALVPPYLGRELAEAIPGASYVELPGIGHSANIEGRAEFNAAVKGFLATLR
ncbi:MAG: Beta-ketoadipate enol-lactone hydrolase [uncultured Thermomicrobiales bacterium]|uniref:Beta-ketoadipate enol-lactone hydrolase n=1 Tax=uncultured Thermomicrobiales bacterium TaxID=1645740 RepID=A0A6J4UTS5_9BACT|nr:MAG: Beta-ketoadipate enol-lactone hydrolase [uncultured Thermomicrobiales bacterium]